MLSNQRVEQNQTHTIPHPQQQQQTQQTHQSPNPSPILNSAPSPSPTSSSLVARRQRLLFVLSDGLADSAENLCDSLTPPQTPLQAARTPNLNAYSSSSSLPSLVGLVDPLFPGVACGSDVAHLSLFGCSPLLHYSGRGAFESLGSGLHMEPGDLAFKSVFGIIDRSSRVVESRRIPAKFSPEINEICVRITHSLSRDESLASSFPGLRVLVSHSVGHRCVVRFRWSAGAGLFPLSAEIRDTDPLVDGRAIAAAQPSDATNENAVKTSALVNLVSGRVEHYLSVYSRSASFSPFPSVLLFRGCDAFPCIPKFSHPTFLQPMAISSTAIIIGLMKSLGIPVFNPNSSLSSVDASESAPTDFSRCLEILKSEYFTENDDKFDFAFVHVKDTDEFSHEGDWKKKIAAIEKIDNFIGSVGEEIAKSEENIQYILVFTADHSTPTLTQDHSCEPVPLLICEFSPRRASSVSPTENFSEFSCSRGNLGRIKGENLMELINKFAIQIRKQKKNN